MKIIIAATIFFNVAFMYGTATGQSAGNASDSTEKTVSYTIRPVSTPDRVNLEISMSFTGDSSGYTQISLPSDKYGTRNIWESVAEFSAENAVVTSVFDKPHLRNIHYKPGVKVTLHYTIAFDPERSTTSSFSPIIESEIFHFFSPQWTLRFMDNEEVYTFTVEFKDLPEQWVAYSNLPPVSDGVFRNTSKQEDFEPFIAGGNYDHHRFNVNGNPVNVIISYHFRNQDLLKDVRKLLEYQRNFFDFKSNQYYLVSITFREDILAGTGLENAFVILMRKGADKHEVLQLLAHETLHNWVPLMADIRRDKDETGSAYKTEFFNEGLTTYLPRVILFQQDLISTREVVMMLNETLEDCASNPYSDIPLDEIQQTVEKNRFNNLHEKVSYYRGDLIGFKWDNQIRRYTDHQENILHFVKKVIAKAIESGGEIAFEDFFALAAEYGINARNDWEKYIKRGEMVKLEDLGWLKDEYTLTESTKTFYDSGFNLYKSQQEETVIGVYKDGPAYKAGLRDGMKIQNMTVSRDTEKPIKIVVLDSDRERLFSYKPAKTITYQKIVKKK